MRIQSIDEVNFTRDNGISLDFESHDLLYKELSNSGMKPIIVNDFQHEFSERKCIDSVNELIRTHYGTDELDTIPRCDGGHITGGYNEGLVCPICNTVVERVVDKPLVSQIWLRPPKGIAAFINPRFWNLFESIFWTKKFNLIEWLTSRYYTPGGKGEANTTNDPKVQKVIKALEKAGIKRGFEFFYNNFDMVMNEVLQPKPYLYHKTASGDKECPERYQSRESICIKMRAIVREYRHCIFSHYLPFPSKLIMVSEEGGGVGYIDKNMPMAFDALKTIVQIERPGMPLRQQTLETKTMKANRAFALYYRNFRKNSYGKKPGMVRRQQGSTRSPHTGRAVIAPRALQHNYDELHTPWAWTISLMRTMIANKLLRMFFTPQEIFLFVDKCIVNSDGPDGDLMEGIFNTLIDESPEGGIAVAMLRNPTLERLSNQLFKITKVIRDTNVNAILMSVLTIKGPNADYDGDQLQVKLLVDAVERAQFSRLRSHLGFMNADKNMEVNSAITIHSECISMVNGMLDKYRLNIGNTDLDSSYVVSKAVL